MIICLLYTFSLKEILLLNVITGEILTFLFSILSNVTSHVFRDRDTDSGNISLISLSVSDGQKTCSSKGVSLIGI